MQLLVNILDVLLKIVLSFSDEVTENTVDWGSVNQPLDEASFDKLYDKVINHLKEKDELFSFKGFAGADEKYRLPVEVINEYAWHNLICSSIIYYS